MINALLIVWVASAGIFSVLLVLLWRRLQFLRREVRLLIAEGELSSISPGPRVVREIHRELKELARRQREVARRIADEDFSLRAILTSMVEGVLIANSNMQIRLVNERLRHMFSLPKSPMDRTVMEVFRNHLVHQVFGRRSKPGSRNLLSCRRRSETETDFSRSTFRSHR